MNYTQFVSALNRGISQPSRTELYAWLGANILNTLARRIMENKELELRRKALEEKARQADLETQRKLLRDWYLYGRDIESVLPTEQSIKNMEMAIANLPKLTPPDLLKPKSPYQKYEFLENQKLSLSPEYSQPIDVPIKLEKTITHIPGALEREEERKDLRLKLSQDELERKKLRDLMDKEFKQQSLELDKERLGEMARHNKAMENMARQRLALSQARLKAEIERRAISGTTAPQDTYDDIWAWIKGGRGEGAVSAKINDMKVRIIGIPPDTNTALLYPEKIDEYQNKLEELNKSLSANPEILATLYSYFYRDPTIKLEWYVDYDTLPPIIKSKIPRTNYLLWQNELVKRKANELNQKYYSTQKEVSDEEIDKIVDMFFMNENEGK
ncbi:MAG: hypothetical protein QXJ06_00630 [Candidatus Aenigmatarchaeota archaeon]